VARFQFLIGRLKTLIREVRPFLTLGFQFLIGRLKTRGVEDLQERGI